MAKEQAAMARSGRKAPAPALRLAGVIRRNRRGLLLTTALQATVVLVLAQPARAQLAPNAAPKGGVVVGGAASISHSANATTINQASQRAAINWQSFNVGSRQAVDFHQPNAAAVALNRVTGPNPSQIAGQINANGQVILENQDGITFTKGAQINTAGFMATAAGITTKNFMAGHMVFDQPAHSGARIVNAGHITVDQAGIAALVAPQVANSGVITARLGHVILAGASTWTLDLYGDGLVSIDVTGAVRQTASGPALVTNTGTILAEGGEITLTARAAAGLVQELISAGGVISAPSTAGHTGQVVLNGVGGSIVVAGALLAQGATAGTKGGAIEVAAAGGGVTLASAARLDASGQAGGGNVAVGTDLARAAGGPRVTPMILAHDVVVAPGATIAADATHKGAGGRVTVLAEDQTVMDGAISAQGGVFGGDGGFVEVSGRVLGFDGPVSLGAARGAGGALLLDPGTLDIVGTGGNLSGSLTSNGSIGFGTGGTIGSVSVGAIISVGSTAAVVLQASTLLDVQAGFSISHDLTLQSGGFLTIAAGQTLASGGVLLLGAGIDSATGNPTQAGGITLGTLDVLRAGTSLIMTSGTSGGITLGSGDVLNAGSVELTSGTSGGIALPGSAQVSASSVIDLSTGGGDVVQNAAGALSAPLLQSSGSIGGAAILAGTLNSIGTLGVFNAGTGIALTDAGTLTVAGSVATAGTLALVDTAAGGVTLGATGSLIASGGRLVSVQSPAFSLVAGGTVSAGTFALAPASGGTVTLGASGPGLSLASLGGIGAGTVAIGAPVLNAGSATAGSIVVAGSFDAAGRTLALYSSGGVSEPTGGTLATSTLLASTGLGGIVQGQGNSIAALGSVNAAGGTVAIADATTVQLSVTGPVSGAGVDLNAGTIAVSGPVTATAGTLALTATSGEVSITNPAVLTGPTIALSGAGSTGIGGTIGTIALVHASSVLSLSGGGFTEASGGTIIAPTLISVGTLATGVSLAGTANAIGSVGTLTIAGSGTLGLTDGSTQTLTLTGPMAAGAFDLSAGSIVVAGRMAATSAAGGSANVTLTGTNGITFASGAVVAAGNSRSLDLSSALGGVYEALGAQVTTAYLQSSQGVHGPVVLTGASNVVAAIRGFTVAAGDFRVINEANQTLGVEGAIQATGHTIAIETDALTFGSGGSLSAASVELAPSSALGSPVVLGAGTAGLFVTPAEFAHINAGRIDIGALNAGGSITGNDISITGSIAPSATVLGLFGNGTIGEFGAGSIIVGTLIADGTAIALGGANTIASLSNLGSVGPAGNVVNDTATQVSLGGSIQTTGRYVFTDPTGTVTVGGSIQAAGITIDPTAIDVTGALVPTSGTLMLNAGTGGITLSAGSFLDASGQVVDLTTTGGGVTQPGGTVIAGLLQSSGNVVGGVTLTGASNSIAAIGNFTVSTGAFALDESAGTPLDVTGRLVAPGVVIGAGGVPGTITIDAGTILAPGSLVALNARLGGITLAGGASILAGTLALTTTGGGVTESGAASTLNLGTLTAPGTVSGDLVLSGSNTIGTLATLAVTGNVSLSDAQAVTVLGTVSAGGISRAGNTATLALNDTGGNVALGDSTNGGTLIAGSVSIGSTGSLFGTLGAIGANTLLATADGGILLPGPGNDIGTLGAIGISGGSLAMTDGSGVSLTLAGSLFASNFDIRAGSIVVSDAINAPHGGSAGVTLAALTNGISFGAGATIAAGSLQTLDLSAAAGGIVQDPAAHLTAANLQSSGGVTGSVLLTGSNNTIAAINQFTVATGDFRIINVANQTLGVDGAIQATGHTIAIETDALTFGSGGSLSASRVELAPSNPATLVTLGTAGSGLVLTPGGFGQIGAGRIDIGSIDTVGSVTAAGILVNGSIATGASVLALASLGTIGESGAGSISVGTLIAAGTAITLGGANTIAALGSVAASAGDVLLGDGALTLSVAGPVSGTSVTLGGGTLATPGTLLVAGSIAATAGTLALAALTGGISLVSGQIGGATVVLASGGGIVGAGAVDAGSLLSNGMIAGGVSLTGANTIGAFGDFTVIGGDLVVPHANTGTLTVAGTIGANNITLGAGAFSVTGSIASGSGAGTLSLTGTSGGVTESGGILAGVMTGTLAGAVLLNGTNTIAALGSLTVNPGGFTLADAGALTVTGPLIAGGVSLTGATTLTVAGTIALNGGSVIALGAGSGGIGLVSGAVNAGAGTLSLRSGGTLTEDPAAIITAAKLTGSGTSVALGGTNNAIGTLSTLTASGNLSLTDTTALTVLGTVSAGGTVGSGNTATLTLNDTGGGITLGNGSAGGTLIGGTVSLASTGTLSEAAGAIGANTLTATANGGITLLGAANNISTIGNLVDTGGGNVYLTDATAVTVLGSIGSPTNIFLQDTAAGGVSIASGGSLAAGSSYYVGVQTDRFTNSGSISGGTFLLAPFTSGRIESLGTGGTGLDLASLAGIGTGKVVVGAVNIPGSTLTVTAGSIAVVGNFGSTTTALGLYTSGTGNVTEGAGVALTASSLSGRVGGGITLASTANAITGAGHLSAAGGDLDLVSNVPTLTLSGSLVGQNIFVEVAQAVGTLHFYGGALLAGAMLPSLQLIADRIVETFADGAVPLRLSAPGGTVAIAPFMPSTRIGLGGSAASAGGLTIDSRLLTYSSGVPGSALDTGTVIIGAYRNTPAGGGQSITAGGITLEAAVSLTGTQASTLDLIGTSLTQVAGGSLSVTNLIGSITNDALLTEPGNTVGTLGAFSAGGTLLLTNTGSLVVTGPVSGAGISLTAGSLGVTGSVIATIGGTVSLTGSSGTLDLGTGADVAGGTVSLVATGGTIGIGTAGIALVNAGTVLALDAAALHQGAAGTIIAGTLVGSLTAATTLAGATTIAAIGNFTDGAGFSLTDLAPTLTVAGSLGASAIDLTNLDGGIGGIVVTGSAVASGGAVTLTAGGGGITQSAGLIQGAPVSLISVGTIGLNGGTVSATTLALGAGSAIAQAGGATILAADLVGQGTIGGSVSLIAATNSIAALGSLTTLGTLTLAEAAGTTLTVNGPVRAAAAVLGQVGAGPDTIAVPGTIVTTGTLSLGANSAIEVGGLVQSTGSSVALQAAGFIGVAGAVLAAQDAVLGATGIGVSGLVSAGRNADLTAGANGIAIGGGVIAGAVADLATPGTIGFSGLVQGATVTFDGGAASVTEASGGSLVATTRLDTATQIGGVIALTNTATNRIASIGTFQAGGSIDVGTTGATTLAGPISGAGVTIAATGLLTATGSITATGGAPLRLTGGGMTLTGATLDGATTQLDAGVGALGMTGASVTATSLALGGAGVTEDSASALRVTTLTSLGGLAGAVNLASGGNNVATLGAFSVSAGSFALTDAGNLAVAGPATAASITVSGTGTQSVTVNGAMTASGGGLSVASGTGGIALGNGAVLSGTPVTLNSGAGLITLSGNAVLGSATETVAMYGAAVSQTGGTLRAASLGGNVAGDANLGGSNAVAALSGLTVGGLLTLNDAESLTIAGASNLGSASLTAPALTIDAPLGVGATLALSIGGAVTEGGGGSVAAGLLSGSVGTALLTGGGNQIAGLADISAGGTLAVTDARALTLSGTIRAPTLVVTTTPYQTIIDIGTQIFTGGIARPAGVNVTGTYPEPGSGLGGAYFSDFVLNGGMTVAGINSGPSIMRIDSYQGGSISFGMGGTGLNAPTTWLILNLRSTGGSLGTISGAANVASLDMLYSPGAPGGVTSLFGTIGGVAGQPAAGAAFIHPAADPRFQFNSCAIGTVNCVVLPVEVLPVGNPLSEFSIGALFNEDDSDDLFLPLVSRRDY